MRDRPCQWYTSPRVKLHGTLWVALAIASMATSVALHIVARWRLRRTDARIAAARRTILVVDTDNSSDTR